MEKLFTINIEDFSFLSIVWGLILGFLAIFLWIFIKKYLIYILFKVRRRRKVIERKLPLFESIFWAVYILYLFYLLVIPFPILGVLITVVLLLFSRDFVNNYIHGLFYRFKDVLRVGQILQIGKDQGIIYGLNNLELVLETKKGDHIYFPYKNLSKKRLIFLSGLDDIILEVITIHSHKEFTAEELVIFVNELPWGLRMVNADVSVHNSQPGRYTYEFSVKSLNPEFIDHIKKELLDFLKS